MTTDLRYLTLVLRGYAISERNKAGCQTKRQSKAAPAESGLHARRQNKGMVSAKLSLR